MADDVAAALAAHGWTLWPPTAGPLRVAFAKLYGTDDLEEVRLHAAYPAEPSDTVPLYAFGNPLESIVVYNWTGASATPHRAEPHGRPDTPDLLPSRMGPPVVTRYGKRPRVGTFAGDGRRCDTFPTVIWPVSG